MYRLFLEAPGFDADLDNAMLHYDWLYYCANIQCLEVILQIRFPNFYYLPVEERFALAVRVGLRSPSDFLKCVGLGQSDQRLASLVSSTGTSVLHYIARRLWSMQYRNYFPNGSRKLLDFGVSVLKNGANPSTIAQWQFKPRIEFSVWRSTPFLDRVGIWDWKIGVDAMSELLSTLESIRTWTEMIQQAGLDLCDYGAKEMQAWKSIGLQDHCNYDQGAGSFQGSSSKVGQLVYGSTPED